MWINQSTSCTNHQEARAMLQEVTRVGESTLDPDSQDFNTRLNEHMLTIAVLNGGIVKSRNVPRDPDEKIRYMNRIRSELMIECKLTRVQVGHLTHLYRNQNPCAAKRELTAHLTGQKVEWFPALT